MDAALTDEELAEQEVGGETELYLTQRLWRRVFNECQGVRGRWVASEGSLVLVLI